MKSLFVMLIFFLTATCTIAAEKKAMDVIDTDTFTSETQVQLKGSGNNHLAMAWWVPNEFWESVFSQNKTTSESDKNAWLEAMSDISLLAVVQADISNLGAFDFYTKEEIENNMLISFTNIEGKTLQLAPMQSINSNLEIVLGVFKPILGSAIGNLGNNMHFYVLNDRTKSTSRLLDPYREGRLNIQLSKRDGSPMTAEIEMPLNVLFVPRLCPNGKEAHISWKYCPWSGKLLEK